MTDPNPTEPDTEPRVLICRGCCCGTVTKHPGFDHDDQVAAISEVAQARIVDCVGECSYSNVVLVRPTPGQSVWFGRLNSKPLTDELCDWLEAGAPASLSPILDLYSFVPEAKQ